MRNPRQSLRASCLAVTMLAACSLTDPGEFLVVELALSDTLAAPGDTVELEVRATNYGLHEVGLRVSAWCPWTLFRVTDAIGEVVGPESIACVAIGVPPTRLSQGESAAFLARWSGKDLSGVRMGEGDYGLQAWVTPIGGDTVFTDVVGVRVTTTPVP